MGMRAVSLLSRSVAAVPGQPVNFLYMGSFDRFKKKVSHTDLLANANRIVLYATVVGNCLGPALLHGPTVEDPRQPAHLFSAPSVSLW